MRKVTITVTFMDKTYTSTFEAEPHVQEYEISDYAYELAMLFADTQILAKFGHKVDFHTYGKLLQDLDYDYKIEET